MKDAKRGYSSNKLGAGDYIARVDRCDLFETDVMGECFKITLTLLATINGAHKEGEVVTVIFGSKSGTKKQWFGNIKGFIATVMGQADDAIDEGATVRTLAEFEKDGKLVAGENVLGGTVCRVRSTPRVSKKSKNDDGSSREYFVYSWAPAMENEEIRQALGDERVTRFFPNGL